LYFIVYKNSKNSFSEIVIAGCEFQSGALAVQAFDEYFVLMHIFVLRVMFR